MPSLPRRIILEKEGHTGRVTIPLSDQYPELGIRRETIPDQVVFCRSNSIGLPLILCQLANERQDERDVLDTCLANFQHGSQAFVPSSFGTIGDSRSVGSSNAI